MNLMRSLAILLWAESIEMLGEYRWLTLLQRVQYWTFAEYLINKRYNLVLLKLILTLCAFFMLWICNMTEIKLSPWEMWQDKLIWAKSFWIPHIKRQGFKSPVFDLNRERTGWLLKLLFYWDCLYLHESLSTWKFYSLNIHKILCGSIGDSFVDPGCQFLPCGCSFVSYTKL